MENNHFPVDSHNDLCTYRLKIKILILLLKGSNYDFVVLLPVIQDSHPLESAPDPGRLMPVIDNTFALREEEKKDEMFNTLFCDVFSKFLCYWKIEDISPL